MNQLIDPEGQRRGQRSCDPLEYQQTGSAGIEERCLRKSLSLSGRQNSNSPFQNSVSAQTLRFRQMVSTDGGVPSEDIYPTTHGRFFFTVSHCKSERHYSSKST